MEFNHQRIVERHTTATEVITENLPIGPLSHLIITLDGWHVAAADYDLAAMLVWLNNIQVTHHGVGVVDLQSEDLYGVHAYTQRRLPLLTGRVATDNLHKALTLIVPFGRHLMDPAECFPATKKGELVLRVDTTVPAATFDNSTISIDAVELVGATPTRYMKSLRKALAAPGATGEREYELPTGNPYVCCQLRMVTVPGASSHTYGIDVVKTMVNNKEWGYTAADMMCLQGLRALRIGGPDATVLALGNSPLNLIAWIDFDPVDSDEYLLDSAGKDSVKLNLNMGVSEACNLTTMELVAAGG